MKWVSRSARSSPGYRTEANFALAALTIILVSRTAERAARAAGRRDMLERSFAIQRQMLDADPRPRSGG